MLEMAKRKDIEIVSVKIMARLLRREESITIKACRKGVLTASLLTFLKLEMEGFFRR